VRPHELDYHNNAACVGGGTRVYGAQASCASGARSGCVRADAKESGALNPD
jgi:hypothetical protein